jgi:hypothetical protein
MKSSPVFVVLVLLIGVAAALVWTLRMHRRAQQDRARNGKNLANQAFALDQLHAIGELLKDEGLPADELEAQSAAILLAIEAINENGGLTAIIDDTRRFVDEECARRTAKAG